MDPRLPDCESGDHTRLIYRPAYRDDVVLAGLLLLFCDGLIRCVLKKFFAVKTWLFRLRFGCCLRFCLWLASCLSVFCGAFQHSLWCDSAWFVVGLRMLTGGFVGKGISREEGSARASLDRGLVRL